MKKYKKKDYIYLFLIELAVCCYFTFIVMIFQQQSNFRALMDSVMVVGVAVTLFGWIIFLSNVGLVEVLEFVIMWITSVIRREPMEKTYFEMVYLREKSNSIAHRTILMNGILFLVVGSVMFYMYKNGYRPSIF